VLLSSPVVAQNQRKANTELPAMEESLKLFLQNFDDDKATRYVAAFRDLNDDGTPEAIVYLISKERCGTGGCNTLILTRDRNSWRIVTNVTITWPPIRVLTENSNGWRSVGVWVQGGGIQPGYEAELRFDGKTYPRNPSVPPARPSEGKPAGEIVISSERDARPLYDARTAIVPGSGTRQSSAPSVNRTGVQSDSPALGPSFNCANATTSTEKLICSDFDLARMDSAMASAYREALQSLPEDQGAALRREHAEWFAQYARACNAAAGEERKKCVSQYLFAHTADLLSRSR